MLLLRAWRWQTALDCEMLISPDTLQVLLTGFTEVVKVTNHNGLWDAKLAWYSLSATHHICLNGLEYGRGILSFRSTRTLIVEFFAVWAKFLETSGYWTVNNRVFILHMTNVFGSFCDIYGPAWISKFLN